VNRMDVLARFRPKEPVVDPDPPLLEVDAKKAHEMILADRAPANLKVQGHLSFKNNLKLTHLPDGLTAPSLDLNGCPNIRELPADLRVRRLDISNSAIESVPPLSLYELEASNTPLVSLPQGLRVEGRINLIGCARLVALPPNLKTGSLVLHNCKSLESLPEDLDVYFLDVSGCAGLYEWPARASVRIGKVDIAGCVNLRELPSWLREVSQLDLNGCANLRHLPSDLRVSSWIDVAGTGISELPQASRSAGVRWRGVPIDERVAFHPETISVSEVLNETNSEVRRVLLERMGYEKFLNQAGAQTLDSDRDPGGERRLLRVPMQDDEPLVCLAVYCPSTGRQYMLRVPPATGTCRQAAAWIAGFDRADDYNPIAET
jgi:hypothetical protein